MTLAHRLQREIKANPAKAVALAGLLIVAGYFWLPLVAGLLSPAKSEAPPARTTASAPPAKSAAPAAASPEAKAPTASGTFEFDWRKHARLIDDDPQMRSAGDIAVERDPFEAPAPEQPPQPQEPEPTVTVVEPLSPAEAGLVLTTTLLGTRKQIADINGKSYAVGDRVEAPGDLPGASFRVVDIQPRLVVLEGNGQRYELRITRPLVDAAIEVRTSRTESAAPGHVPPEPEPSPRDTRPRHHLPKPEGTGSLTD
jgi:hypothetical protein